MEARHNSRCRPVRPAIAATTPGSAGALAASPYYTAPQSWINLLDNNGPTAPNGSKPASIKCTGPPPLTTGTPDASYPAEDNTYQAGSNLTTLNSTYTAAAVSEAFDEPLDPATVKSIVRLFVTPASGLFV